MELLPRGQAVPARQQDRGANGVAVRRRPGRARWLAPNGKLGIPHRQGNRPLPSIDRFWQRVRAEADLHDVRLHDLRHSYASIALRHGETLLTIGKLLGHNDPATTLKYTHLVEAKCARRPMPSHRCSARRVET